MKHIKFPDLNQGDKVKTNPGFSTSSNTKHPAFSFKFINKDKYGLDKCTKDEKAALINKIHRLSQLPWSQINSSSRDGLGCEKISKTAIKAAIPSNIKPDTEYFNAFRFNGKAPMVGYRDEKVFYIIWLDRDFTLYDHGS